MADLTGLKVNHVTVLKKTNERRRGYVLWKCRCVCGKTWLVISSRVKSAYSCGCRTEERTKEVNTRHGEFSGNKESRLHRTWRSMIDRCYNKNAADYPSYGGRGIRVCRRWRDSFEAFRDDMGKKPSPKHQLDRQDNDGPYKKSNCHWVLPKQNCRNRRTNHPVTYKGRTMLIVEWAEETGISKSAIASRLRKGWSPHKALTTAMRSY